MSFLQFVFGTPVVTTLALGALATVGAAQRFLGPGADYVEGWRERWWLRIHELMTLVGAYSIGRSEPAEYVCSLERSPEDLEAVLWKDNYHRNLLAAKKRRGKSAERQWSASSWVYRERFWADKQLHVTLYRRPDGGTDCYIHREASNIKHPIRHIRGTGQTNGDPNRTFRTTLDEAGIERFTDEQLGV